MVRIYTVEGTYRDTVQDEPRTFTDTVAARCAEQAFVLWERKHTEKSLLRFESVEPLF